MIERLALVLLLALPTFAYGKVAIQGIVNASGGWTDNVLSQPRHVVPGQLPAQPDGLFLLAPQLVLTTGAPRALQRLSDTFTADLFVTHSEANSYADRLDWSGVFLPSKTTELFTNLASTVGRLNTLSTLDPSASVNVGVVPPGGTTFFEQAANLIFTWQLTPDWRWLQSAAFTAFIPLRSAPQPNSYLLSQHVEVERLWRKDAFGLDLRVDYVRFDTVHGEVTNPDGSVDPNGVLAPRREQLINELAAKWRRDWGRYFNTELTAGVVEVMRVDGGGRLWQPVGLLALRFLHEYAHLELSYAHNVVPDAIFAQTFLDDTVALRGTVPLGLRTHVFFATSASYGHDRLIDALKGKVTSTVDVYQVDATLGYRPRPYIEVYARYSFFNQIGRPVDPLPIPSFFRDTILVGMIATYPTEAAAVVPRAPSERVDQAGQTLIPAEHSEPVKN